MTTFSGEERETIVAASDDDGTFISTLGDLVDGAHDLVRSAVRRLLDGAGDTFITASTGERITYAFATCPRRTYLCTGKAETKSASWTTSNRGFVCGACARLDAAIARHQAQAEKTATDAVFSMDAVVKILTDAGHEAYVEQTGGGVATIYGGRSYADAEGYTRFEIIAGPGSYTTRLADEGFCYGHDDEGESEAVEVVGPAENVASGMLAFLAEHADAFTAKMGGAV